jgi:hypothetical protein
MTKDDIMRMAREAGMHDAMVFYAGYERFANLVYAAAAGMEREEILKMSRNQWFKTQADFEKAIEARGNTC